MPGDKINKYTHIITVYKGDFVLNNIFYNITMDNNFLDDNHLKVSTLCHKICVTNYITASMFVCTCI